MNGSDFYSREIAPIAGSVAHDDDFSDSHEFMDTNLTDDLLINKKGILLDTSTQESKNSNTFFKHMFKQTVYKTDIESDSDNEDEENLFSTAKEMSDSEYKFSEMSRDNRIMFT